MKKLIFLFFSLALLSCEDSENVAGPGHVPGDHDLSIGAEDLLKQKVASIENIFYSIPSPTVTIDIIEEAGAVFDVQLTNNPQKLDDYTSKAKRALNMGVYGADVNYCSAFNKTADVMMLLACTRSLGEELGLESIFNQTVIDRLNDNRENTDSVQAIITSTFWEIESKLEEDDRPELAALIVIGGWVEGLNIACGQAKLNANNKKMIGSIADQSVALDNVIGLAKLYSSTNTSIKEILESLEDLQSSFAKIEITESPGSAREENGIPTIGVKIDRKITDNVLQEIMLKIHLLRTEIVA